MAADQGRHHRARQGAARQEELTVWLRVDVARGAWAARVLRSSARAFLRGLGRQQLSLSLVGDREMRKLNRAWRGKDKPTDVLSFSHGPGPLLGDVVISLDTARRQASEGGWPLSRELRRLLAHGMCHCQGYDHERPRDAARMARAEKALLGERGMVGDSLSA
jgi:probable rRNA maturation factor